MPSQIVANQGDEVTLDSSVSTGLACHRDRGAGRAVCSKARQHSQITFVAEHPGVYRIICHDHEPSMRGEIVVLPRNWLPESSPSPAPEAGGGGRVASQITCLRSSEAAVPQDAADHGGPKSACSWRFCPTVRNSSQNLNRSICAGFLVSLRAPTIRCCYAPRRAQKALWRHTGVCGSPISRFAEHRGSRRVSDLLNPARR